MKIKRLTFFVFFFISFYLINKFFICFTFRPQFLFLLSPCSLSMDAHLPSFPSTPPLAPFRKWHAPHGLAQSIEHQVEEEWAPSPALRTSPILTVSDSIVQATRWSNTWQGPRSVPCRLLKHQSIVHVFPRVQVSCLCGFAPTSVMTLTSTWVVFIRNDF